METSTAFSWDDAFEVVEEPEYITLPPGEYTFVLQDTSLTEFAGSDKLPPCPMAETLLRVDTENGPAMVKDRLYYCSKMKYKISSFLRTLGLAKAGDTVKIDWTKLTGRTGHAKISTREYNGRTFNQVDRYVVPKGETAHDIY